MRRVICDQCRKEEPPDEYNLAPKGWRTVRVSGPPHANAKEYCSIRCERVALEAEARETDLALRAHEVPASAMDQDVVTVGGAAGVF